MDSQRFMVPHAVVNQAMRWPGRHAAEITHITSSVTTTPGHKYGDILTISPRSTRSAQRSLWKLIGEAPAAVSSHSLVLDAIGVTARFPEEAGGRKGVVEGEQVQRLYSLDRAVDGVSGVQLVRIGGQVGAGYYIRIRGVSSLTFSAIPAVFIDGIRLNMDFLSGSSLDLISPSQVGRIEVLRGSAAGVRYGPDALNGVILITTRRGNR